MDLDAWLYLMRPSRLQAPLVRKNLIDNFQWLGDVMYGQPENAWHRGPGAKSRAILVVEMLR